MIKHFKRWNKWRKKCLNSRIYKLVVLLKLKKSPTLDMMKQIEEINIVEAYESGLKAGESYARYFLERESKQMTINEYQQEALRTENGMFKEYPRILNGLMGLAGESGEAIDLLKKSYFQGHELDREHLAKELGDVAWYLAVSADALGYDLETVLQMNVDKLRTRYPDGFESERSQHREANDI